MKYIIVLFLSFLLTAPSFGQNDSNREVLDSIFEKRYYGGMKGFLETVYKGIQYPFAARTNRTIGVLITKVDIDKKGKLKKIEFLNKIPLGDGLEDQVVEAFLSTAKRWKSGDSTISFQMSFVFWIGEEDIAEGDIKVIAYGSPNGNLITSKKKLLKRMEKFDKKKQYEKALKVCEQLLKRDPKNKQLLEKYDFYLKNTTKK